MTNHTHTDWTTESPDAAFLQHHWDALDAQTRRYHAEQIAAEYRIPPSTVLERLDPWRPLRAAAAGIALVLLACAGLVIWL